MQIIGVQFYDNFGERYHQKTYTYYCPFPVEIGDIVLVPMTNDPPEREVKVCKLNISPNDVNPNRLKDLRTVLRKKEEA